MFEEFMGIPAHPLIVHAAVVLVPLQVLGAVLYALVPFTRRFIWWLVLALAVVGPLAAFVAKLSGDAFRERMIARGTASEELLASIDQHSSFGLNAVLVSVGLGIVMILFVALNVSRSRGQSDSGADGGQSSQASKGALVLTVLLTLGVLGFGGATGYYIFKTGDSGAKMVWTGS
jgi:hypothetical protein